MGTSVIYHGPGVKIGDTRKALRDAARSSGDHVVQVDMSPPSAQDAEAIMDMAYGCERQRVHDFVKGEAWNRRAGRWYAHDRRDEVLDMRGGSWLNQEAGYRGCMYHVAIYKRDEEYEARMAAWAERFIAADERELVPA
jgi:hypothetical protein